MTPSQRTALRQRQSAADRRDQVILAALREFAEQGYQAASTAAIARRAGISQPYIYALFPNKQELFVAVHDHVIERIRLAFGEAVTGATSPEDALHRMGMQYPGLIADRYALLLQLQSYAVADPEIRAHVAREYRALFDEVQRRSGASHEEVAMFFAAGMFANVTTALDLADLCGPLFEQKTHGA
ncbi:MAG TPA: TetR/AcrR family transcriptional regulator [Candidatus Dormibacteraeota bacterium]|jgi:AcrR family transcriptional regulator|nr:TetR/AcrR family transcriptional regulator [Candidatus Dormibacteraeota bacterium]